MSNKNEYEPPRGMRIDLMVPAEKMITDAIHTIEEMGADTRLTEAQVLLDQARSKVADYVDEHWGP